MHLNYFDIIFVPYKYNMEAKQVTFEPLTLEKFEEFCKEFSASMNNSLHKEIILSYPKAFYETLDDKSFLHLLTNDSYRIIGGSETVDYVWDRYHSLVNVANLDEE